MKQQILNKINQYDNVTYAELCQIPGFEGEYIHHVPGSENLILWPDISKQAAHAIDELIREKQIQLASAHYLTYMADGMIPKLPFAKNINYKYKTPHWLPVIFKRTGDEK